MVGGAVGLVFAKGGLMALLAVVPDRTPRIADIGLDATTLAFTAAISLAAGLLFGLIPVLRYGPPRPDVVAEGRRDGARARAGEQHRLRSSLVVTQMAPGAGPAGGQRAHAAELRRAPVPWIRGSRLPKSC